MPRYKLCGSTVALPTAPAWTFGEKHHPGDLPWGPGAGKYPGSNDDWNNRSTRFGGLPGAKDRPWQNSSAAYTGTQYLKPDYLSQNPKGPAWSFGQRFGPGDNGVPGPGRYAPNTNSFRQAHATWGPPPRPRPPSAPPRPPPMSPDRRRSPPNSSLPGATFKGARMPLPAAASPGPAAYRPCCTNGCCDACEKYNGKSFGLRPPRRQPDTTPAPGQYNTHCVTLGSAANGCERGCSDEGTYYKSLRTDHRYPR